MIKDYVWQGLDDLYISSFDSDNASFELRGGHMNFILNNGDRTNQMDEDCPYKNF
jgi:hypothetical protein